MPGEYVTIEVNGHQADQAAVSLLEHGAFAGVIAAAIDGCPWDEIQPPGMNENDLRQATDRIHRQSQIWPRAEVPGERTVLVP